MLLGLLSVLERLVFCANRGELLAKKLNSLLGWTVDRVFQAPVSVALVLFAAYFVQGFLNNSLADAGPHPAPLMVAFYPESASDLTNPADQSPLFLSQARRTLDLPEAIQQSRTTEAARLASSAEPLTAEFVSFGNQAAEGVRAQNTPEETAALTRAALAATRHWN